MRKIVTFALLTGAGYLVYRCLQGRTGKTIIPSNIGVGGYEYDEETNTWKPQYPTTSPLPYQGGTEYQRSFLYG